MNSDASRDNEALARQICERREVAGKQVDLGTFVAIADGRVVGMGNSFEEADAHLEAAGITAGEGMICEVAVPETETVR